MAMETKNQQVGSRVERKPGTPGPLSRWVQRKMNARTSVKIRRGRSKMMGMDLLILNTVGRRSGQPRETPLAWFADGDSWSDSPRDEGLAATGHGRVGVL
jgi:hypothetical protein